MMVVFVAARVSWWDDKGGDADSLINGRLAPVSTPLVVVEKTTEGRG